jgi:2-isopropylmalate synthase
MKNLDVQLYDTTLRDGTQAEGVSLSKTDKILIADRLDSFGVSYIEGGWPGSNPKDMGFFEEVRGRTFKNAKIAAFGSTRRANNKPEDDHNLQTLLAAETPVITIFGKSWLLHVEQALKVAPDVNLQMVMDSCAFLKQHDREVIFDAEHFFDGYKDDPDYAVAVLLKAVEGGAETVVLCDTNGGMLPHQIAEICGKVSALLPPGVQLGIHCHNDSACAVANSLTGVLHGVTHIHGTINGIGERCGNANLCEVAPGLELKMNKTCLPDGALKHLREMSRFVYDLANMRPDTHQPYVGDSAFAHKGGIHVNAVQKESRTYEHIAPEVVGNKRRVLISDLAGGSNIMVKAAEHSIDLDQKSPEARNILKQLKHLEGEGYEYEAADASFFLLLQKMLNRHEPFFDLEGFRVIVEKRGPEEPCLSEATIKIKVGGETELTAAEGDGPVNALDSALRKVLVRFYPDIDKVHLRDFKVRILEGDAGTAAKTRVLIESGDGENVWGTVGVSENIIEASWQALVDSVEYILFRNEEK